MDVARHQLEGERLELLAGPLALVAHHAVDAEAPLVGGDVGCWPGGQDGEAPLVVLPGRQPVPEFGGVRRRPPKPREMKPLIARARSRVPTARPLACDLPSKARIVGFDPARELEHLLHLALGNQDGARRVGEHVLAGHDPDPAQHHGDVCLERGHLASTPARRLARAVGSEVIAGELIEVAQAAVGEDPGEAVLLHAHQLGAPTHRCLGVAVAREHEHLARPVSADRLVEQVREVEALGIERRGTARKVGDCDRRTEEHAAGRGRDEVQKVASVAMQAPHGVDEVGALECRHVRFGAHARGTWSGCDLPAGRFHRRHFEGPTKPLTFVAIELVDVGLDALAVRGVQCGDELLSLLAERVSTLFLTEVAPTPEAVGGGVGDVE